MPNVCLRPIAYPFVSVDRVSGESISYEYSFYKLNTVIYLAHMAKAKKKSTVKKTIAKKHPLLREIPTLNSMVIVFWILIGILFVAIYFTRFA